MNININNINIVKKTTNLTNDDDQRSQPQSNLFISSLTETIYLTSITDKYYTVLNISQRTAVQWFSTSTF